MRFLSTRAVCLLAALAAFAGCGAAANKPKQAAQDWVAALRAHDWASACDALIRAPRDCPADLASQYDGRTLTLLPPGAYANGDEVTDNRSRFALRVSREHRREGLTYFVVRRSEGRLGIEPQVSVEAASSR